MVSDFEIVKRNRKAYENGQKGEKYIQCEFNNVEFLNGLIDALIDDNYTEIKTCQQWQSNGKWRCRGRFVLDWAQHDYLVKNGGYYIFIVLKVDGSVLVKKVRASEVQFKKKLGWTSVFFNSQAPQSEEKN